MQFAAVLTKIFAQNLNTPEKGEGQKHSAKEREENCTVKSTISQQQTPFPHWKLESTSSQKVTAFHRKGHKTSFIHKTSFSSKIDSEVERIQGTAKKLIRKVDSGQAEKRIWPNLSPILI